MPSWILSKQQNDTLSASRTSQRVFKRFFIRTLAGAALLAAGLQAGAASALSFNFTFSGPGIPTNPGIVTGIVEGLVDNASNQITGVTATITSSTNGPSNITFSNGAGSGFDVSGGQITGGGLTWFGTNEVLELNGLFSSYITASFNEITTSNGFPIYTPLSPASVPGPLPLLGAGAAFGWSRRLRRRIKQPA
jgi:hypothetical protein